MQKKRWYQPLPAGNPEICPPKPKHIVVLTGAGISAESGLPTFRDSHGLWQNQSLYQLASIQRWRKDRAAVLEFYNQRRQQVRNAQPNAAHYALVELAKHFRVNIITQNVDDLHERAGSENVLHLHGEILKARSTANSKLIYSLGDKDIQLGDRCERGSQLRPHVVWFGEAVTEFPKAKKLVEQANVFLVVGTSLSVYPAASLVSYVKRQAPVYLVSREIEIIPERCQWFKESATIQVPLLVNDLLCTFR
jgi:NAD-dependent deacetylase